MSKDITIEDVLEKEFNEWEKLIPKELSELLSDFAMNHTYPVRGVLRNLFKAASLNRQGWTRVEQDEILLDISRFAVSNKKPFDYGRTEDGKDVLNIWVVDIPKVLAYIKSKYQLMPLPNIPEPI